MRTSLAEAATSMTLTVVDTRQLSCVDAPLESYSRQTGTAARPNLSVHPNVEQLWS